MFASMPEKAAVARLCPMTFGPKVDGGSGGDSCVGRRCAFWRFVRQSGVALVGQPAQQELVVDPIRCNGDWLQFPDPSTSEEPGVCLAINVSVNNLFLGGVGR